MRYVLIDFNSFPSGSIALPEITGFVQGPKSEVLVKHMDNKSLWCSGFETLASLWVITVLENRADEDLRKYFAIVTKQVCIGDD